MVSGLWAKWHTSTPNKHGAVGEGGGLNLGSTDKDTITGKTRQHKHFLKNYNMRPYNTGMT